MIAETARQSPTYDHSSPNSRMLLINAALLLHVAIQDGSPRPWMEWTDLALSVLMAATAKKLFELTSEARKAPGHAQQGRDRRGERRPQPGPAATPTDLPSALEFGFLLLFFALPFVVDLGLRRFASHGNPLEIQVTLALRNLMFGLSVLPRGKTASLAIFTSLFLAIYGALVTVSAITTALLATYALLGLWWLMGNYWQRISAHFPDESTTEIPYFARFGAVGLVLVFLASGAFAFRASEVTSAIAGFLPSSGGQGGSDPFARGGVGDGDQMVGATEDASSFGPIESELFLESQQPTLYDMFIENYDEPVRKKRGGRLRAIPLTSKEKQKQNHNKLAQNKKASREFSAIRRESSGRKRPKLDDLTSKALVYVAGRSPLHLGLAIFDHWDGRALSLEGELPTRTLRLVDKGGANWVLWDEPVRNECFGAPERHQLKIINLKSPTVPAPPSMTGAHIDRVHDERFFRWQDGMLRLSGDKIPSLSVIHVESIPLRRSRLDALRLSRGAVRDSSSEVDPGDRVALTDAASPAIENGEVSDRIRQLAADWTNGAKSDWQRVARICDQLRSRCEHDPSARVPEDVSDAVEHFLFVSRRGPDYLFATSAAVMLRSLGYQSRVISGLYVDPDNYDRMAKATGVYPHNVHFWPEVQTDEGVWVALEPTPGFRQLYAQQTLQETLATMALGVVGLVLARPMTFTLGAIVILALFACRGPLYRWLVTSWWRVRLNTSPRKQVLRSVLVLQRLTNKKSRRPAGQTLDQWITSHSETWPDGSPITDFRTLVSWACYASSDQPAVLSTSVRQVCLESVRLLKQRV